jgi:hypothetical protein
MPLERVCKGNKQTFLLIRRHGINKKSTFSSIHIMKKWVLLANLLAAGVLGVPLDQLDNNLLEFDPPLLSIDSLFVST